MSQDDTNKVTAVPKYKNGALYIYQAFIEPGQNYIGKTDGFLKEYSVVRHSEQPNLTTGQDDYVPTTGNVIVSFRTNAGGIIKYDDLSGETITMTMPQNYEHPVMCSKIYSYDNGSTGIVSTTDIITYELVGVLLTEGG